MIPAQTNGWSRRHWLQSALGGVVAASAGFAASRPNVIVLLVDDLGWMDFGCQGNTFYETPNIDRFASESLRFTNGYAACPVCSPSRAAIMTGKYPARLHLTDWIPGRKQWPQAKLLVPAFEQQLPHQELTIAEALKPLGYRTASIGKWHLGGDGFGPVEQGFDLNVAGTFRGSPPSYFGPYSLPNCETTDKAESLTERLTNEAGKFIERVHKDGPFFLYLPEFTVHLPLQEREAAIEKYRRKSGGKDFPNPIYSAMVESLDTALGQLRAKLAQLGLGDNTAIFLTSDNGGLLHEGKNPRPVTDNRPLRAGKGHLYEGGVRVPFLAHWPGVTPAGKTCDVPVCGIDLLPTIVDMAGGKPGRVDGLSIAPLLRGGQSLKRDALYWHYPHYSNQGGAPGGVVRAGRHKLIEFYDDNRLELYDLQSDIGERTNLVNREPKVAARLHRMLKRWREETRATMPQVNPGYDPAKAEQGLAGAEKPTPPAD